MSDEVKQIQEKLDLIGSTFEESKSVNNELLAKVAKNEGGQAELKAKQDKIDADLSDALEAKSALEKRMADLESGVKRMGGEVNGTSEIEKMDTKAFDSAMKKMIKAGSLSPERVQLDDAERKSLSVQIDPDGGYTVSPFMGGFEKRLFDTSPVRSLASVMSIGTNQYDFFYDDEEMGFGWVGETQARPSTSTAQIGKGSIQIHEMYANVPVSQQLLEDSAVNILGWAGEKVADRFARGEATSFVTGDGVAQPRGFTTYTKNTATPSAYVRGEIGTTVAASATAITSDELIDLRATLQAGYRGNAYFAYNRNTEALIRKLVDGQGNYLWQPSFQAGEPDMLMGQRTVIMEDMPDAASNAVSVALADFRDCYQIVDRIGISLLEDPFSNKPYRNLYYRRRTGAGLKSFASIKLLQQGA